MNDDVDNAVNDIISQLETGDYQEEHQNTGTSEEVVNIEIFPNRHPNYKSLRTSGLVFRIAFPIVDAPHQEEQGSASRSGCGELLS